VRAALLSGIGVKVYACGLYVDPAAARAAVGDRFVGRAPADVCKDQSLYSTINSSADVEKTVRLTFARDIDSAKIVNALSGMVELETLSPRHHPRSNPRFLTQIAPTTWRAFVSWTLIFERIRPALGESSASLKEFEGHFEGVTFKKGQSLTFSAVKAGHFTIILITST